MYDTRRGGRASAFERLLEFEIVGCVADGVELVEEAQRLTPDATVTDVSMPRMGGDFSDMSG